MKRVVGAIALLACTVVPASADGYYNNNNNQFQNWQHNRQYYKNHHHNNNNNNNNNKYNGWQLGGAFLGGLVVGEILNDRPGAYYAPQPPAYANPYPQYQPAPAPRWAGPRYCETMTYYDAWGNLVQSRDCYR